MRFCNGLVHCAYKTLEASGSGCVYQDYCDHQAPRDSRSVVLQVPPNVSSPSKVTVEMLQDWMNRLENLRVSYKEYPKVADKKLEEIEKEMYIVINGVSGENVTDQKVGGTDENS